MATLRRNIMWKIAAVGVLISVFSFVVSVQILLPLFYPDITNSRSCCTACPNISLHTIQSCTDALTLADGLSISNLDPESVELHKATEYTPGNEILNFQYDEPKGTESCGPAPDYESWQRDRFGGMAYDYCNFYTNATGVAKISNSRWATANAAEAAVWNGDTSGSDRSEQHSEWFDQYNSLIPFREQLGRILEVGAGPYTQSKTILEKLDVASVRVLSITLADPLMIFYHTHTPACSYKDGSLLGFPTTFIAAGAEDLFLRSEYDTVIMINVLEHVRDALKVLQNLHNAVKPGGLLIFSERWFDKHWVDYEKDRTHFFFDVLHPITVKRAIFEELFSKYTEIYRRNFFFEGNYPGMEGVYFIGSKKR